MIEAALFVALLLVGVALAASVAAAHILHQFAIYECMSMRSQVNQILVELAELRNAPQPAPAVVEPEPERHPADVMGYDAYRKQQIEAAHREYMERTSRRLPCDWTTEDIARYMGAPLS